MSAVGSSPGVIVTHPNREKAAVRTTRAAVLALLLASTAMIAIVTAGGIGAQETILLPIQIAFAAIYLLVAWLTVRWRRGGLPVVSGFAVLLAIFALVGGTSWFEREHPWFGAAAINPSLLGTITFALVPLQALLIAFAMRGFNQGWNVEVEVPASRA